MDTAKVYPDLRETISDRPGVGIGFSDTERVELAAALVPRAEPQRWGRPGQAASLGYWLDVSPGNVQLRTGRQTPAQKIRVVAPDQKMLIGEGDGLPAGAAAGSSAGNADLCPLVGPLLPGRSGFYSTDWQIGPELPRADGADDQGDEHAPTRGRIAGWSRKSRANMVRQLGKYDYSPMFARPDTVTALTTLTYPGDWVSVCPHRAVLGRHFEALLERFRYRWGFAWVLVWKLEFQRRGAPHLHLYGAVPATAEFRAWLSAAWFEIVGSGDPAHLVAGTGVDYSEGDRFSDPKRIAVYFSKHGLFSAKDYQNEPPEEWESGTGRYWGQRGLTKAVATAQITQDALVETRRLMRKVVRSQKRTQLQRKAPTLVRTVDSETGEVVERWKRGRARTRRFQYQSLGKGGCSGAFLSLNDAPAFAAAAGRYLTSRTKEL